MASTGRLTAILAADVAGRLQNPELQAVADLRRHAAALQRARPFRP
jgi:hypothetical protein